MSVMLQQPRAKARRRRSRKAAKAKAAMSKLWPLVQRTICTTEGQVTVTLSAGVVPPEKWAKAKTASQRHRMVTDAIYQAKI